MLKRLTLLWTVLRGDARQLWFALRHPAAPGWLKLGAALIALYVISPIDIIPDFIPVIAPEKLTILAHFSVSIRCSAQNCSGVPAIGTPPRSASLAFITGSANAALISRLRRAMAAGGVPLGAAAPNQALAS
jgi:hypothetical protein